jgi:hypothetical protein
VLRTTIVLPVSREQHLLRVFASLENLECDRERTGFLVFVDGEPELYLVARNLVEHSKFSEKLCVQGNIPPEQGVQHQYAPAPHRAYPQRDPQVDQAL